MERNMKLRVSASICRPITTPMPKTPFVTFATKRSKAVTVSGAPFASTEAADLEPSFIPLGESRTGRARNELKRTRELSGRESAGVSERE